VLAAIEAVLVAKKVPEKQREAVMAAATEKLAQRIRDGQVPKVKVYDKAAPSQRPVVVPCPRCSARATAPHPLMRRSAVRPCRWIASATSITAPARSTRSAAGASRSERRLSQDAVADAHAAHQRPRCLCLAEGVEMYVARLGGRATSSSACPDTGSHHAPDCPSYEPPAEFSGLGQVLGSAITEDPATGETTLKLDFPLSKMPGRSTAPPSRRRGRQRGQPAPSSRCAACCTTCGTRPS
jgi:hypothetical protein